MVPTDSAVPLSWASIVTSPVAACAVTTLIAPRALSAISPLPVTVALALAASIVTDKSPAAVAESTAADTASPSAVTEPAAAVRLSVPAAAIRAPFVSMSPEVPPAVMVTPPAWIDVPTVPVTEPPPADAWPARKVASPPPVATLPPRSIAPPASTVTAAAAPVAATDEAAPRVMTSPAVSAMLLVALREEIAASVSAAVVPSGSFPRTAMSSPAVMARVPAVAVTAPDTLTSLPAPMETDWPEIAVPLKAPKLTLLSSDTRTRRVTVRSDVVVCCV